MSNRNHYTVYGLPTIGEVLAGIEPFDLDQEHPEKVNQFMPTETKLTRLAAKANYYRSLEQTDIINILITIRARVSSNRRMLSAMHGITAPCGNHSCYPCTQLMQGYWQLLELAHTNRVFEISPNIYGPGKSLAELAGWQWGELISSLDEACMVYRLEKDVTSQVSY